MTGRSVRAASAGLRHNPGMGNGHRRLRTGDSSRPANPGGNPFLQSALALGLGLGWASALMAGAQPDPPVGTPEEMAESAAAPGEAGGPEPEDAEPAQPASATGDPWLDRQLQDIDRYGRRYREAFIDELVRYREAPRGLVEALLDGGWSPGDVYFACSLARVTGRSCRFVANQRGEPAGGHWHKLAMELGAGPGTDGFARLKRGVVHSYQRWARPLELDAELAESFPGHGPVSGK